MTTDNPIESVLRRLKVGGLSTTPEGFEGYCPVCGSKKKSFRVAYVGQNGRVGAFFCHRCGVTGDLVGLLMRAYRMERGEAERMAADTAGWARTHRPEIVEDPMGPWEVEPYRTTLSDYLADDRGLDPKVLWDCHIGFDIFSGEVVIPCYDKEGTLVGVTRREARDGAPYIHSRFRKAHHVWGIHRAKDAKKVYVTEGQLDAVALQPLVAFPVVSTFGSYMSEEQARLLAPYHVVMAYDNDEAGEKGTRRAIRLLRHTGATEVTVLRYPTADPGDLPHESNPELTTESTYRWLAAHRRASR